MKISDSIETTSGLHVFETPEDLIINSQVYDKFTMEPKPYNFFNIQTLANKNLLLHEVNILENDISNTYKEIDYEYYIQDNQNPDIFYCLLEVGQTDNNQYFHKIQKVKSNYKLIKSISPNSDYVNVSTISNKLHYKILGQTKNYIIIQQQIACNLASASMGYWGSISAANFANNDTISYISIKKSDLSVKISNICSIKDINVITIKECEDKLFLYENRDTLIYITVFSPETNTHKIIFTQNKGNIQFSRTDGSLSSVYSYTEPSECGPIPNIVENNGAFHILITCGGKWNYGSLLKLYIDFNNETVSKTWITVNCPNNLLSFRKYQNSNANNEVLDSCAARYDINMFDDYLMVTTYSDNNQQHCYHARYSHKADGFYYGAYYFAGSRINLSSTVISDAGGHRTSIYKYNANSNTYEYVTHINPTDATQYIYGLLHYNKKTIIVLTRISVDIYKFDTNTNTFKKIFEKAGTFQTIGLDENNNFYTFDANNKCDIYNRNSCSILNGKFEYDTYNYDNEDIETNVTIASKNFIGELIASKIHIELSGNCQFRNGNQEAILTTRLDTEYQVPVIITGPGVVYCNINEVE